MANPQTRPPNQTRSRRRPPKGPRPVASDIRARLTKASAQLKADGHPELAGAVEAVLEPGGWSLLRATQASDGSEYENLALSVPEPLRDQLRQAAEAMDTTLSSVANEGIRAVAEGRWVPPVPVRVRRGSLQAAAVKRVTLNVRVETAPRKQVEAKLPALSKDAGRRITVSHIALSWLRDELGVTND